MVKRKKKIDVFSFGSNQPSECSNNFSPDGETKLKNA